jgi:hypothetical protein
MSLLNDCESHETESGLQFKLFAFHFISRGLDTGDNDRYTPSVARKMPMSGLE